MNCESVPVVFLVFVKAGRIFVFVPVHVNGLAVSPSDIPAKHVIA